LCPFKEAGVRIANKTMLSYLEDYNRHNCTLYP
jgi:hypothetical protein